MMAAWARRWRAVALAGFFGLLLAACATPNRIVGESGGQAFDRTGRFAVTVAYRDGHQDAVQGGFAWHDAGSQLVLDLANPLGSTLARVKVSTRMAVMTRSNGDVESAADPDALVAKVLGSPIPVAGLRDWLRGQTGAAPVSGLKKNPAGQPMGFEQAGWQVALSNYDTQGPRLLRLSRGEADRDISVRLVVDGD